MYQVNGFPSLQLLSDGKVFEYAGERSVEAMRAFAEGGFEGDGPHARPMPARPSLLDPLLNLPGGVAHLLQFATTAHPLAAGLLAASLIALGVLAALACRGPQFLLVHCPPGVSAGDHFLIELPWRWWRRQMRVAAPPGITAGQPFFVPLTAPPVARHRDDAEKKSQ